MVKIVVKIPSDTHYHMFWEVINNLPMDLDHNLNQDSGILQTIPRTETFHAQQCVAFKVINNPFLVQWINSQLECQGLDVKCLGTDLEYEELRMNFLL